MNSNADLFPETLLISRQGDRIYTTSIKLAEHFGKRHDDVLKLIRKVISQSPAEELLRNFAEQSAPYVLKGKVRQRPFFELSHDGFAIVAMSFTGAEAMTWKWKFLAAFRALEAELNARTARYAAALDQVRPMLRPVVECTEAGYSRADIAAPLGKSPAAITYHRRTARRLGLLAH